MNLNNALVKRRILRRVYDFIDEYGTFSIDYKGEVRTLGDTVDVRKPAVLFKYPAGYYALCVDAVIPNTELLTVPTVDDAMAEDYVQEMSLCIIRYLMDNLKWGSGGYLVLQYTDDGLIYGFKEGVDEDTK